LIVTDASANRMLLRSKLACAYFEVSSAETGAEALERAGLEQPDMILLDLDLPDIDGAKLCAKLKAGLATAHIPVIILTSEDDGQDRIRGVDAGADDFLPKSCSDLALFARLRNLMRMKLMFDELRMRDETAQQLGLSELHLSDIGRNDPAPVVLVAPSTLTSGLDWLRVLDEDLEIAASLAGSASEMIQFANVRKPDLLLVSRHLMDGSDGLQLISALRSNPATGQAALVFVTDEDDEATAAKALDMGATDYLTEPFVSHELVARVRSQIKRKQTSDRLRANVLDGLKQAVLDPLTGLYNRRYAVTHIQGMFERTVDSGTSVAVMMLDLDKFKSVNDEFGHASGDLVLTEFARRLQANVRGVDLVARIGGEEFCVAMPETTPELAKLAAERVRGAIEDIPFWLDSEHGNLNVTVSIGVAVSDGTNLNVEDALRSADLALYASKHRGRNCVSFFQQAA